MKGVINRGHLLIALRAGFVAHQVAALLVVFTLAPWYAAHSEFPGHEHPPGTEEHVHGLEQVIGWLTLLTVLVVVMASQQRLLERAVRPSVWHEQLRQSRSNAQRAPPAAPVLSCC